jgi:hypothetical protein
MTREVTVSHRPLRSVVGAIALGFAATLLGAAFGAPASAAPSGCSPGSTSKQCLAPASSAEKGVGVLGTNCPSGFHCVFFFDFSSASHQYFNGDSDFRNDTFNVTNDGFGAGQIVNDNVWSASNTTSANRESHFYYDINPTTSSRLAFCINPGHDASWENLSDDGIAGNGVGQRDEISALIIRPRTPVPCF